MANSTTHSQLPPICAATYTLWAAFRAADGTAAAPTSLDTEISKDGGTFAEATNEVTLLKEVGGSTNSALGYITLTATEMSADTVCVQIKSANCVPVMVILNPMRQTVIRAATAQGGAATTITLDANASAIDEYYRGAIIRIGTGTGAGQARFISGYVGSTKVATISPGWETNPSSDSTFAIGCNASSFSGGQIGSVNGAVGSVTGAVGSVTGSVGSVTGAVGSVTSGVTVSTIANGAITAAAIATDAIDADAIKADAVAEIADGVWDEAMSGHTTAGTFGKAIGTYLWEVWRRLCNKIVVDRTAKTVVAYADDNSTPLLTMTEGTVSDVDTYTRS